MKYLIACLGNMHPDYDGTRHNVGFQIADYMVSRAGATFKNDTLGDIADIKHKGRTLTILKPSTYMNLSGKAVRYWLQKKKINPENLLVIVDDLHIEFGKLRMRGKGSDGGHNGLKDIMQHLGSNYARLRVGIGNDFHKGQQVNFVLGKWSEDEKKALETIIPKAADAALSFSFIGTKRTMDQFNG